MPIYESPTLNRSKLLNFSVAASSPKTGSRPQYDERLRVQQIGSEINGQWWSQTYGYDATNNLTSLQDGYRGSFQWYYDGARRLVDAFVPYDDLPFTEVTHSYAENGTLNDVALPWQGRSENYVYSDSSKWKPTEIQRNRAAWKRFAWSPSGMLCSKETVGQYTDQFSWTPDGRIAKAERPGTYTARYVYDHTGRVIAKIVNGVEKLILGDLGEVNTSTSEVTARIHLPYAVCELPSYSANGKCYWNDLMNVGAVSPTDGTPNSLSFVGYGPYGQQLNSPPGTSKIGFNGKEIEPYNGLINYGARFYDPEARLFLSVDPLRASGAEDTTDFHNLLNAFAYANGNPTTRVDLAGGEPKTVLQQTGVSREAGGPEPPASRGASPATPSRGTPADTKGGTFGWNLLHVIMPALDEAAGLTAQESKKGIAREHCCWIVRDLDGSVARGPVKRGSDDGKDCRLGWLDTNRDGDAPIALAHSHHGFQRREYFRWRQTSDDMRAAHELTIPSFMKDAHGDYFMYVPWERQHYQVCPAPATAEYFDMVILIPYEPLPFDETARDPS